MKSALSLASRDGSGVAEDASPEVQTAAAVSAHSSRRPLLQPSLAPRVADHAGHVTSPKPGANWLPKPRGLPPTVAQRYFGTTFLRVGLATLISSLYSYGGGVGVSELPLSVFGGLGRRGPRRARPPGIKISRAVEAAGSELPPGRPLCTEAPGKRSNLKSSPSTSAWSFLELPGPLGVAGGKLRRKRRTCGASTPALPHLQAAPRPSFNASTSGLSPAGMSLLQGGPESFPSLGFWSSKSGRSWGAVSKKHDDGSYIISALASHRTLLGGAKSHGVRRVGDLFYLGDLPRSTDLSLLRGPRGFPLSSADSCPCSKDHDPPLAFLFLPCRMFLLPSLLGYCAHLLLEGKTEGVVDKGC